ncbi:hypothetical protein ACFYYD_18685 [Streptomyces bluensis]|uniref:hypothetical protein n=1 Tax=Streptomyces bluensis TaxID=33897 RepID=UPI00369B7ACE
MALSATWRRTEARGIPLARRLRVLVLHRFADHQGEAARVVRDRKSGIKPVTALHRHFRAGLDRYDPVTGLNDHPEVVAFHRLVFTTPSLAGRLTRYQLEDEEVLADALGDRPQPQERDRPAGPAPWDQAGPAHRIAARSTDRQKSLRSRVYIARLVVAQEQ